LEVECDFSGGGHHFKGLCRSKLRIPRNDRATVCLQKTTDAAGLASPDVWLLGTVAGSYTLTAAASGVTSATFTAAASADVANAMSIVVGNSQSAPAGRPVAIEPSVKVVDVHNNAVAGIEVLFEVASGGGTAVGAAVGTAVGARGLCVLAKCGVGVLRCAHDDQSCFQDLPAARNPLRHALRRHEQYARD
jgi:hypothetical protein